MAGHNAYNKIFFITIAMFFVLVSNHVSASEKAFIKEHTYRASDIDSKVSCRAIALEQVKRLLLEELGTYLISETEVSNYQLTKDQVTTLTAGIVMATIIDEKWDGQSYYLKAKITTDPQQVAKAVDALKKDKEMSKELTVAKKKADDAMAEVERLRNVLKSNKTYSSQQNNYSKAINELSANDLFYAGFAFLRENNYKEAITTFSKAIELNPKNEEAYNNRGLAYSKLGLYRKALDDLDQALLLSDKDVKTYLLRGIVCENLDMDARDVVLNYDKAIQFDPLNAEAYYYKGTYHINQSRGYNLLYDYDRNWDKGIDNYRLAARLGHKKAQGYLRSWKISW